VASLLLRRTESLVIYHLTFLICHLRKRLTLKLSDRKTRGRIHQNLSSTSQMTNEKCQMIYDQ
jgi:hypothetical protein